MADFLGLIREWGYTQTCVAHGIVSWRNKEDAAGELQLWSHEIMNKYYIYARETAGDDDIQVCKVIDVYDKIRTLLTKKSKFHFVQY